eukprot:SAG31_NODE_832_length_11660_cov_2.612091_9_plen_66_part_00
MPPLQRLARYSRAPPHTLLWQGRRGMAGTGLPWFVQARGGGVGGGVTRFEAARNGNLFFKKQLIY